MAGLVPPGASRLPSRCGTARQSLPRLAAVLLLAMAGSGCAFSGQFGSLFAKQSRDEATAYADPAQDAMTGSVSRKEPAEVPAPALPPESDLAYARAALLEVLNRGSKDVSAPWENPKSRAHGTVTPIATSYAQDGNVCRDFLASHVAERTETWMQGEACRSTKGAWQVKSLRAWKRS